MKILLVEDHPSLARSIKKGLEIHSHVVDMAEDGEEGYDLASNEEYDVLILDWMLPEMSGVEICQKLRGEGKETPILMLTAKSDVESRVKGLDVGADDYLGKPFAFEELVARVKALGRRKSKKLSDKLSVEDLSLDLGTYVVERAGQPIKLSKKELSLLEFLMRNEGMVFTSEQLVEKVWPFESDVTANSAQVYIGYLRKKIDRSFSDKKPLIQTVRGLGYKIEGEKK